ncbi:glycosyltransferase family 92 protein RCOM_0530710 [Primulina tabacum]|uniref:glycosyltransferase family 92 protein RCOM_0530710 n=1 Tax=Primulina tabacum TaxID=48773 RepID=UPI003F59C154
MARKIRTTFPCIVASIVFCASIYHHYLRRTITSDHIPPSPITTTTTSFFAQSPLSSPPPVVISTTSVLLHDWEVLVIVSPQLAGDYSGYSCLFDTDEASAATFTGVLPFPDRFLFNCVLPVRARRRLPFRQPSLLKSPEIRPQRDSSPPLLLRWSYLVYDSLTTEDDVVLFVKGVNTRQGINRDPKELMCVFGDYVKTAVKTSMQEVFRCQRPKLTAQADLVKVSLEILAENRVVPSVAYYTPPRKLASKGGKFLLCASTMVYNVAKFLKEWVFYHSKIGVEKFLLYDNGSDDDLGKVVEELVQEGFDVTTYLWLWPKTQESGFSHAALYASNCCKWMMYIDVDEFLYSPSWKNSSRPSESMLSSLVSTNSLGLGQFEISCYEFGPSNQEVHPIMGVTQGYDCRLSHENRHKSIVLLEAIDDYLLNVIHHFNLSFGFKSKKLSTDYMVLNHYKYQAWPEFKAKFRRRVSAYVLDWTQKLNPNSNDRTPGLGFMPVEPEGWPQMFCELRDDRLKDLTWKWFGEKSSLGYDRMAWQRGYNR